MNGVTTRTKDLTNSGRAELIAHRLNMIGRLCNWTIGCQDSRLSTSSFHVYEWACEQFTCIILFVLIPVDPRRHPAYLCMKFFTEPNKVIVSWDFRRAGPLGNHAKEGEYKE